MKEQETIPKYLFVTKIHENKVRAYKLLSSSSNNKYLYEELGTGFKECFLYADIFSTARTQGGYSNSTYKEQKRNEKVRKRRRSSSNRRKKGVAYERRFK